MYSIESRIRYSETDNNEELTLPAVIDYFQDVAIFHSEDIGAGGRALKEDGQAWVLCSWQIEIIRLPQYADRVRISTKPYEFRSFVGNRNCMITDLDGNMLVKANSIWAFMDMINLRPVTVPEKVRERFGLEEKLEMDYKPRRIAIPDEGGELLPPIVVERQHLDSLGHVNNGQFVKLALSVSVRETPAKNIRVEYKTQAHLGDILVPVRYSLPDKEIIVLKTTEDGIYTTLELAD